MAPTNWPIERIAANLERSLAADPDDVDVLYPLARAHAFAFAMGRRELAVWPRARDVWIGDLVDQERFARRGDPALLLDDDELRCHLVEALRLHARVARIAPERPEAHLGLAYVLEIGAPWAGRLPASEAEATGAGLPVRGGAAARRRAWLERAAESYLRAFHGAIRADLARRYEPLHDTAAWVRSLVACEAGTALLRLLDDRALAAHPFAGDADLRRDVASKLAELWETPRSSFVTPIVLSLDAGRTLDDLLSDAVVRFDLDGDLVPEPRPWLRPEAGLLCWDPAGRGEIRSGRSFFGTASAWLFFRDGYRALAALDDDGDGALAGLELVGIAVWFDRDGDASSDPGEVLPVGALGISTIETRPARRDAEGVLSHPEGLGFADGKRLPTWDWIAAPVVPSDLP